MPSSVALAILLVETNGFDFFQTCITFYFICHGVLTIYMYVHHMCAWSPQGSEEGIRLPGTGLQTVLSHYVHARDQT